jgi:DNA-3-methyladenine glycosylase
VSAAHPALSGSHRDPPSSPLGRLGEPRDREFFELPSPELASRLLGEVVVHDALDGRAAGIIVETEAYAGPDDRASHARAGRTRRTAPMFGPAGHAYVYLVYGLHHCLNVVSGRDGEAGAVLVRAILPLVGAALMRRRRGSTTVPDARLGAGPALVCQSLGITRALDGYDLTTGQGLWIAAPDPETAAWIRQAGVAIGPRIGVGYAGPDWASRPWRFGVSNHPSLSRRFPSGDTT